jgi:hypothetical protein
MLSEIRPSFEVVKGERISQYQTLTRPFVSVVLVKTSFGLGFNGKRDLKKLALIALT